ncbi:MAG: DUF4381 domain-containing protein [Xanthobacteraceae bacterium]
MSVPAPALASAAPALAPELAKQLEQLRDIHLPPGISWWPLAPGWWVLAGVVIVAALAVVGINHVRRRTVRYRALNELNDLRRDENLGPVAAAERIAVLLKRIVLQRSATRSVGVEHGTLWIERLTHEPGGMPVEIARFLALAPYADADRISHSPDRVALFTAADRWIRRNA